MSGPYVPVQEVAKHFNVHEQSIRLWRDNGHIPRNTYIQAGSTYRYNLEAIIQHLTGQRANAQSDEVVGVFGVETSVDIDTSLDEDAQ